MKNKLYYIWSRKWTNGYVNTFWCSNDSGYTTDLNQAGLYKKDKLRSFPILTKSNIKKLKYADNSKHDNTFAIAVEDIELLGKKISCILN